MLLIHVTQAKRPFWASSWRGGHGLMSSRGIRRGGGEPHGDMKSPDVIDTEAEQRFRQALDDASLHLRLSLNVAVALGR